MNHNRINQLYQLGIILCLSFSACGQIRESEQGNTKPASQNQAEQEHTADGSEVEILPETVTAAIDIPLSDAAVYGMSNGNACNYGILATDGEALYGMNYAEGGFLSRFDVETGTYRNLMEAPVNQINMVGDRIICAKNFDTEEGCIVTVNTDGSEEQVILEVCPTYMRVVEDWIYYCDAVTHYLERVKLDGSEREVLCDKACYYISTEQEYLVFQMDEDGEALYRMNLDGSGLIKLTEYPGWYPICHEGRIYFKACTNVETGEYALQSMDINGQDVQTLAEHEVSAMNISVETDKILFSDATDGKLYQVSLDGTDLTEVKEYENLYKAEDQKAISIKHARQICVVGSYVSMFFDLQRQDTGEIIGQHARIENSNHIEPFPDSYEGFQKEE